MKRTIRGGRSEKWWFPVSKHNFLVYLRPGAYIIPFELSSFSTRCLGVSTILKQQPDNRFMPPLIAHDSGVPPPLSHTSELQQPDNRFIAPLDSP